MPPTLSPQSIQVARILEYLKQQKHLDITVITADCVGAPKDNSFYADVFNGLKVVEIKSFESEFVNLFKTQINKIVKIFKTANHHLEWGEEVLNYIEQKKLVDEKTVVMTFSCPFVLNLLGASIKEKYKPIWFSFNSDPWAYNVHVQDSQSGKTFQDEKRCFALADELFFTSDETKDFYAERYPQLAQRMNVLEHSFDAGLFPLKTNTDQKDKVTFSYIGTFYGTRTPVPLLQALEGLSPEILSKIQIRFVGVGFSILKYFWRYKGLFLSKVQIIKQVSYLESLRFMQESDVLLLIDGEVRGGKSVFYPSKLVDYIGSGKPVLGITPEGTSDRIIRKIGGLVFRRNDIEGIKQALIKIIDQPDNLFKTGDRNEFSTNRVLSTLERVLKRYAT